jgi:SAM-dependent methyltransferase
MNRTESAEAYVTERYRLWRTFSDYDYKHRKGARIAQIIGETGGLADRALELGVGPGGIAATLSRHGVTVVGIDLSPDALEKAREHCRTERVALLRASGFQLPFRSGAFPLVYASQVLHLFESGLRLKLMEEAFRVLQPGGRFVFDLKNAWSHPWRYLRSNRERRRRNFPSATEIHDLLTRVGFTNVETLPGVLGGMTGPHLPNNLLLRRLAHTMFFVVRRPHAR